MTDFTGTRCAGSSRLWTHTVLLSLEKALFLQLFSTRWAGRVPSRGVHSVSVNINQSGHLARKAEVVGGKQQSHTVTSNRGRRACVPVLSLTMPDSGASEAVGGRWVGGHRNSGESCSNGHDCVCT
jgi:hypothetical protein